MFKEASCITGKKWKELKCPSTDAEVDNLQPETPFSQEKEWNMLRQYGSTLETEANSK